MPTFDKADSPRPVTPALLREWPLPMPEGSKYSRGQLVVIGGARRSPGAALLAGEAALRVGAGRLTLAVGASVAALLAVAVPESGVALLDETADGHIRGCSVVNAADDISNADALIIGPGLDDAEEAAELLRALPGITGAAAVLVLDAFALGVLRDVPEVVDAFRGRLVLTPNRDELERLCGHDVEEVAATMIELSGSFGATISCQNLITAPNGEAWFSGSGAPGLGTSGSGDVLAGAIGGLAARGAKADQAAVWGTYLHATAGDEQSSVRGSLGYLARELLPELPIILDRLRA